MESTITCENDSEAPTLICPSNNSIVDPEFCMENLQPSTSKSYLQDFNYLDHFPLNSSSFNPDIGIHVDDGFDHFNPFFRDSSSGFELLKIKDNDQQNDRTSTGAISMQNCRARGLFLSTPNGKYPSTDVDTSLNCQGPQPLSFVFRDDHDRSSCASAGNMIVSPKRDDKRRKNVRNQYNGIKKSEPASGKKSGKGRNKTKSAKGQWTIEEDKLLVELVEKHGVRKWSQIAQMLMGRIGKQCRERWHNHLRPDIKKDVWTEEEDRILIEAHAEIGNKWAEITKKLPGRTENSIKNHWNATKRRQFSRRKCRTKWPKPSSLLQNYIKNLNFEKGSCSGSRNGAPAPAEHKEGQNVSSQKLETDFSPVDQVVPDYEFDEIPEFSFGDDHDLFEDRGMELFSGDIPRGHLSGIDDDLCFDVELPFDLQSGVKKEVDFFHDKE